MPPKRKALAEVTANKDAAKKPRNAKESTRPSDLSAPKSTPKPSRPKSSTEAKTQKYKYSNANTLSNKPSYLNLQWPNFDVFIDDEDQDVPKEGELIDPWCDRVSDLGLPVSEPGMEMCEKLATECDKRNQDQAGLHIYNDWNGWGISEVMVNHLAGFNRLIFKKTASPYQKFAYVEAFACFVMGEELAEWMNNEDGNGVREIIDMIGVMVLTSFDMLSEHGLFKPDSEIKNLSILCLILLDFVGGYASVFECQWGIEVVRMCDEAGIDLEKCVRKQVSFTKQQLKDMRASYVEKQQNSEYDDEGEDGKKNGYEVFARMENWTPEDDFSEEEDGRLWYRWDWKLEYNEFKKNHIGGAHHDLSKMSKAKKKKYSLL